MDRPMIREYSFITAYTTYDKDEIFLDSRPAKDDRKSNDAGLDIGYQALLVL